eukprot:78278_1
MAAVEEHTVSGQMKKKKSSELVGEKQADGSTAVEPLDLNINVVVRPRLVNIIIFDSSVSIRNYVIDVLPSLKSLDFIAITPSDHEKSDTWNRMLDACPARTNWYTCTTEQVENKYM